MKFQADIGRAIQIDGDVSSVAAKHVAGSARMTPFEQLDVYREQFWLRHSKSLRDDFPTVKLAVGDERFDAIVTAYLRAHPPDHFRLRDLSAKMPEFLAETMPDDPLLADCARLEWALLEAFDAADAPPLDPASVAAMKEDDWPGAVLALHPSMRFLDLAFAVKDYREAVRAGETPERPARTRSTYVAYRRGEKLFVEPVEPAALVLLKALAGGEPLGTASERAAAIDPKTEEKIGEWFQRWVTLGWVSAITASSARRPG